MEIIKIVYNVSVDYGFAFGVSITYPNNGSAFPLDSGYFTLSISQVSWSNETGSMVLKSVDLGYKL